MGTDRSCGEDRDGRLRRSSLFRRAALAAFLSLLLFPTSGAARLSWRGPVAQDALGSGPALSVTACAPGGRCVALTPAGSGVSFDPAAPRAMNPVGLDAATPTAVSCPTTSLCVAVDVAGGEIAFDSAQLAVTSTSTIDPSTPLSDVSCVPGASGGAVVCVAVDVAGNELTFNPAQPSAAALKNIDQSVGLVAVSCASSTLCVAVDAAEKQVTFNPTTQAVTAQGTIDFGGNPVPSLTDIVCLSSTACVAFDSQGKEITINPGSASLKSITLDVRGNAILAAACPSANLCTAIDAAGNALVFAPGGHDTSPTGTGIPIGPAGSLRGLACPGAASCLTVSSSGQAFGYNPLTGAARSPVLLDAVPVYSAVACRGTTCTAADESGDAVTFDAGSGAVAGAGTPDPGASTVYALSCPAVTQCTAVDGAGREATFNPQAPTTAAPVALVKQHPLLWVSCPLVTQCTAVDDDRYEVTFDPQQPAHRTYADLGTPVGVSLNGVDCPTATLCTAVDAAGEAVSFNPRAPGHPSPVRVFADNATAVACPASALCVAIAGSGDRATFDPRAPGFALLDHVDSAQPATLACPSATVCVTSDTLGRAVEFDPHGHHASAAPGIGSGHSITGLACASIARCAAVDNAGEAFVAAGQVPAPPRGLRSPTITGDPVQNAMLVAATGAWSGAPTSFAIAWDRCDARGGSCRPIAGASGPSWRPGPADAGHRLRVRVSAANAGGAGGWLRSGPSALIIGLPRVDRLALTGVANGRPRLRFRVRAPIGLRGIRTLSISLPAGLSWRSSKHPAATVSVTPTRALPGLSARIAGRALTLTLRRSVATLGVSGRWPLLHADAALVGRVRRHAVRHLTVMVAVRSGRRLLAAPVELTVS